MVFMWFKKYCTAYEAMFGRVWIRIAFPKYWKTSYILRVFWCPEDTRPNKVLFTLALKKASRA